jgi:hypothetical protein
MQQITTADIKQAVREVLIEMGYTTPVKPTSIKTTPRDWHDTTTAFGLIGLDTSEQLRKLVRDETLRIGIEVRDRRLNNREKPRYQFHIEKCKERLAKHPSQRSTRKKKSAA